MPKRKVKKLSRKLIGVREIRTRVTLSRFMTKAQVEKIVERETRGRLRELEKRGAKIIRVKKIIVGQR